MTGMVEPTTQRSMRSIDAPTSARRSFMSRLSLGHVIMIMAGLIAFLLVFSLLKSRDETFQIATAAVDLPAGTSVDEDTLLFAEVGITDRSLLGSFLSPEQGALAVEEGWVVTRTIPAGDPVRLNDFRSEPDPSQLRAMSIPIERSHAVAGVLQAGDLVDIIVVRSGTARYVATGTEVLDVGGGESQLAGGFTVTVAVDGATSLRLASAVRDGGIEIVRATGAIEVDPLDVYDPLQDEILVLPGEFESSVSDPGTG